MDEILKICEFHSKKNNYLDKCEILTSRTAFSIYEKESDYFIYLGVVVNVNGIDWEKHWQRLKAKSDKILGSIRDLGCNSYCKNFQQIIIFVQPVMEYGLALCHKKKDLEIPLKRFSDGMKIIFGVSPDILGIWANVN